jgi:hypothetical protein
MPRSGPVPWAAAARGFAQQPHSAQKLQRLPKNLPHQDHGAAQFILLLLIGFGEIDLDSRQTIPRERLGLFRPNNIWRKYGKTDVAMVNKVLCKIIRHNICCLIQETHELGIDTVF